VGSTNLNPASWLGDWELDVVIEDDRFGQAMEQMFLNDLSMSTEIVLGNTVGAAITNRRTLGPAEASIMQITASLLIGLALVAFLWPRVVAIPLAVISVWCAISLAFKALRLRSKFEQSGKP